MVLCPTAQGRPPQGAARVTSLQEACVGASSRPDRSPARCSAVNTSCPQPTAPRCCCNCQSRAYLSCLGLFHRDGAASSGGNALWPSGCRLRSGPYGHFGCRLGRIWGARLSICSYLWQGEVKSGLKGWFLMLLLTGALELVNTCGHRCAGLPGVWVSVASGGRRVVRQTSAEAPCSPGSPPHTRG